MKQNNQPIFVEYANASLKDDPEIFWRLYSRYLELDPSKLEPFDRMVRALVDSFKIFATCDNEKDAERIYETELAKIDRHENIFKDVGRSEALKWSMEACFDECDECPRLFRDIASELEHRGLRGYQCVQNSFRISLRRFIESKEFNSGDRNTDGSTHLDMPINFLMQLINSCFDNSRWSYRIRNTETPNPFKTQVVSTMHLFDDKIFYPLRSYTPFHDLFFRTIVGGDFANFLATKDRRKLKQCPYCHQFFVADDIRRRRCKSALCEREYQKRKKRLQREKEPEIYS
jgi:hypothetical protein